MFDKLEFRILTKKIIAAEIYGFWSDWNEREKQLYSQGKWEEFSKSRGYSDKNIYEYKKWLGMIEDGFKFGINPFELIKDLTEIAANNNIKKDKRGEIYLSSKFPELGEILCHG